MRRLPCHAGLYSERGRETERGVERQRDRERKVERLRKVERQREGLKMGELEKKQGALKTESEQHSTTTTKRGMGYVSIALENVRSYSSGTSY